MEKKRDGPQLTTPAKAAIEKLLGEGVNACVRLSPEGKIIVEAMTRTIIYRAP